MEEKRWLDALRRMEEPAVERLLREYQDPIHRFLRAMVRDAAEAEDLCQEVMLRAIRNCGSFRGECSFRAWIYRIARNLALNHLASHRVARRSPSPPEDLPLGAAGPLPDPALWRAVARLPPGQRQSLLLRVVHGLTHKEAAQVLGVSEGTVKTQCHLALGKLRRWLRET